MSQVKAGILYPDILEGLSSSLQVLDNLLNALDDLSQDPADYQSRAQYDHLSNLRLLFAQIIGSLSEFYSLSFNHHPWHELIHGYMKRAAIAVVHLHGLCEKLENAPLLP